MLDKRSYSILEKIVNSSQDGDSVVLEKEELLSAVDNEIDEDELAYYIEDLALNEMISVKYKDDNLYVITPLSKGRVAAEKKAKVTKLAEIVHKEIQQAEAINYKKIGAIAGFWAFIGGMFAAAVAFLVARFS
ncbi:MAG: hypothetical protein ACOYEC_01100 [Christensenellales bacterium]|jgi:hypothetical protein|nr:hypothetical protein [Clostridiales bacterium]